MCRCPECQASSAICPGGDVPATAAPQCLRRTSRTRTCGKPGLLRGCAPSSINRHNAGLGRERRVAAFGDAAISSTALSLVNCRWGAREGQQGSRSMSVQLLLSSSAGKQHDRRRIQANMQMVWPPARFSPVVPALVTSVTPVVLTVLGPTPVG